MAFFCCANLAHELHESLICFAVFRRKARDDVAEIVFVEGRIFADCSGEEAFAKRAEWNEPDSEFLQRGDYFRFRLSPPQGVFALERGDGLNRVGTTDGFHACFGESEMLHFAFLNQIFYSSRNVFDRDIRDPRGADRTSR